MRPHRLRGTNPSYADNLRRRLVSDVCRDDEKGHRRACWIDIRRATRGKLEIAGGNLLAAECELRVLGLRH